MGIKSFANVFSGAHRLCPVDPADAIFDFLPQRLLPEATNLSDFGCAFALDKLMSQTDIRQAIYVREQGASQSLEFWRSTLRALLFRHGEDLQRACFSLPAHDMVRFLHG